MTEIINVEDKQKEMADCNRQIRILTDILDKAKEDYHFGKIDINSYNIKKNKAQLEYYEIHLKMNWLEKFINPLFKGLDELMLMSWDISSKEVSGGIIWNIVANRLNRENNLRRFGLLKIEQEEEEL